MRMRVHVLHKQPLLKAISLCLTRCVFASKAYIRSNQTMGWGEKAIEIRSVETGHLDGVFMHKRAQRLKFLCERNDKVPLSPRPSQWPPSPGSKLSLGFDRFPRGASGAFQEWICRHVYKPLPHEPWRTEPSTGPAFLTAGHVLPPAVRSPRVPPRPASGRAVTARVWDSEAGGLPKPAFSAAHSESMRQPVLASEGKGRSERQELWALSSPCAPSPCCNLRAMPQAFPWRARRLRPPDCPAFWLVCPTCLMWL